MLTLRDILAREREQMREEFAFRDYHHISSPTIAGSIHPNLRKYPPVSSQQAMHKKPACPQPYVALFLIGYLIGLGGCAKDDRLRLAQANNTLAAVEFRLVEEVQAGNIPRRDVLLIDPAIQAARAALDDADARRVAGEKKVFDADLRMAGAIFARLVNVYLGGVLPTTQPTVQP